MRVAVVTRIIHCVSSLFFFPQTHKKSFEYLFLLVDGRGVEFLEYRWLRLEDGTSSQPIMVKLFSTSQPESHLKLHPRETHSHTRVSLCVAAVALL